MEKENKQNFIELPLHAFKKKAYQIPSFLLESKLQRSSKNLHELKKIIEAQDYACVSLISEQRNIFCVKLESNDKLGIIEVKEASSKNRCIYVSLNLNSSLKKQIRPYFLMKNWRIQNKIYIQDERGAGIALLQYNFAEMDLRNFINKQHGLGSKLPQQIIHKMTRDLLQNLCYYHLQQITILDIRPETILFENGKWFILNGDFSSKVVNEFGSTLSRPINMKFVDKRYLSPAILQNQAKSDSNILHNPYKSDVYSLGLIFLELFTLGVIQRFHFKQILETRKGINQLFNSFQNTFRQKLLIVGQKQMKIPNMLGQMLAQKQQNRSYIFQLCFMMKFTTQLLSKILPPFEQFFKKQIIDQSTNNRKKIIYSHCPIEYEGQINLQELQQRDLYIREGRGVVYYNGQRIFDGQWHQNIPSGKCMIQFSQLLSFEGYLEKGLLHGQGLLSFNGSRIGQSRWYEGLSQQKSQHLFQQEEMQNGYYIFQEKKIRLNTEILVYYHKIINNKIKYIINLVDVSINQKILKVLKKMLSNESIQGIKMVGIIKNLQYYPQECELIRLNINNKQNINIIEIITGKGYSLNYLQKIFNQINFKISNLDLDCSNNISFTEESFRQLVQVLPRIRSLNISYCSQISDSSIRFISQNKNCLGLVHLSVEGLHITDKSLTQLLVTSTVQRLQSINICNCKKLSSQKVSQFFAHEKTFNLKSINISGVQLDHHGFQKILFTHNFKNVIEFNVGMCHKISENMMSEFIKLTNIDNLNKFYLYSTTFKDPILQLLSSQNTVLNSIKKIDFSGCINFTSIGFSKYFMSQNILQLQNLNLSGTQITDQLLSLLSKKSFKSSKIKDLTLSCCYALTDKGIKDFLKPDKFIYLKKLNLSRNNFSNDTLFVLSQVTSRQLNSINLSKCSKVNDLGVQKFLNSQNVRYLRDLDLSGTGIRQTSILMLTTSKYLNELKNLNLSECRFIEQLSLIQFISSQRISRLNELKLNNNLLSQRIIDAFENNPYLIHNFVNISIQNCKNITQQMINRLCFLRKIGIINNQNISILKNDPRQLCQNFLLYKMTQLQINKKQIENIDKIFQSDYAINLSKINLNWIYLDNCLYKISKNLILHNIKYLSFAGSIFKQDNLQNIIKSSIIKHLQYLDLSWTQCSNSILFAMAQSTHLNSLRTLKLARCHCMNDKGFQKYFSTSKISTIILLDLRSTLITNSTLQCLFSSKYVKNLSTICLRSCPNIKDSGFIQYFKNGNCSILKDFDISWTKMTGQIFNYMSSSKKLNQLNTLRISGLKGIQYQFCKFIESSSSSSLSLIQANYSQLSSKLINSISSSRFLNGLQQFEIKGYNLDDISINALSSMIRSSNTSKLKCLKLTKGKNQFIDKLYNSFNQYMGKIEHLCMIGLTDIQLQKWKKTFKKCRIENKDNITEV